MADPARYRTIARDAVAEIVVRRSRFRCTLRRVGDADAARAVVAECRSAFFDARHHCSAMVIGPGGAWQHSSDDGEPPGTAGTPILQALLAAEVSDVVAVVTRWFGGTLLGTGGLARAYGDAARAALAAAGTVMRVRMTDVHVDLPQGEASRVEAALRDAGVTVLGSDYGEAVTLHLAALDPEELAARLAGLTSGTAEPRVGDVRWVDR